MGSLIVILIVLVVVILAIAYVVAMNVAFFGGVVSAAREPKHDPAKELAALERQYMANASQTVNVWAKRFRGKTDEEIAAMIREKLEADQHALTTERWSEISASRRLENAAYHASLERMLNAAFEIARAEREATSTPRNTDEGRPESVK
jgi:hypothetical protein